jgi:outer membrane receptor protein involved in Fe transport
MVAAEYGERGELPIRDRDWALVNTDLNPVAGWSGIGNPGTPYFYVPVAAGTADFTVTDADGNETTQNLAYGGLDDDGNQRTVTKAFVDPQCEALGAFRTAQQGCGFQYTYFDNLIEETKNTKLYSELNIDLSDDHRLHFEAMYSDVDIPAWKTSPSYPPQSLFGPDRRLLENHPGLVDFNSFYGLQDVGGAAALTAANIGSTVIDPVDGSTYALAAGDAAAAALAGTPQALTLGRAMGVAGAFLTGEAEAQPRQTETYRLVAAMDGTLFDQALNYDVSISWSKRERFYGGQDMYVERMGLALKGYGGPNCTLPETVQNADGTYSFTDPAAAAAAAGANGCEYYNPFSRAVPFSVLNDTTNADYNSAVANSEGLLRHLIGERGTYQDNELLVFQAVFSGETGIELAGGNVGYAFGAQSRNQQYDFRLWDIGNRAINPCPYTSPVAAALGIVGADQLSPNCTAQTGNSAFLAATDEESTERTVYGVFGELAIPLTEDIDIQAALRFEDYGGEVGGSLDPKLAVSWRVTEELSIRGSASTTFRGPPQSLLAGTSTALSYVAPTGAFKAIDTVGNPLLGSEEAVSTNFGMIYQTDNFYGSIDYWAFSFKDSFQTEGFNSIINAYSGNDCLGADGVPTNSAVCNELRTHIFPVAAHTSLASTERIVVNWLNGQDIDTSGIDFKAEYRFDGIMDGSVTVGIDGTYGLEYERDAQLDLSGNIQLAAGGDLMGFLNYNQGSAFTSKPELKLAAHVAYEDNVHYAGLIARHIGEYDDAGAPAAYPWLATIDSHTTFDLNYVYRGMDDLVLSASVVNVTDEDPPAARGDLNYDPFTHNAFGRMIKLSFTYTLLEE